MKRNGDLPSAAQKELFEALRKPLAPEAYRKNTHGFGISINDGYARERLNEVLGPGGWPWKPEPKITSEQLWMHPERFESRDGKKYRIPAYPFVDDKGAPYWEVTAEVAIVIPAFAKTYHGQGGWRSTDRGNARKGAITDAFGKSMMDLIAPEVYKGDLDADYALSQKGARSIYLSGFESGWMAAISGLGDLADGLKAARKEWNAKEKVEEL